MAEDAQLALDLYPGYPGEPEPGERWIRTPREHGLFLHAGGLGCISIAQKASGDYWREFAYPVEVALDLLDHHRDRADVQTRT